MTQNWCEGWYWNWTRMTVHRTQVVPSRLSSSPVFCPTNPGTLEGKSEHSTLFYGRHCHAAPTVLDGRNHIGRILLSLPSSALRICTANQAISFAPHLGHSRDIFWVSSKSSLASCCVFEVSRSRRAEGKLFDVVVVISKRLIPWCRHN